VQYGLKLYPFKEETKSILFKGPGCTAQKTLASSIIKAGRLGLYREHFDDFS
jgi:hypothetical protein